LNLVLNVPAPWFVASGFRVHLGLKFSNGGKPRSRKKAILDTRSLCSYACCMEFQLTPDQEAFVRQAIASGRLLREEDAVKEALSLWEERERTRAEFLATLEESEVSLARGEGRAINEETVQDLAEDVHKRGLARLAAEKSTPR